MQPSQKRRHDNKKKDNWREKNKMKKYILNMSVFLILLNNTSLFPQNFLQHRNFFQLEDWMFYKGDILLSVLK